MTLIVEIKFFASSETIFHRFAHFIVDLSLFDIVFRGDLFNRSIHFSRNLHYLRRRIFGMEFIPKMFDDWFWTVQLSRDSIWLAHQVLNLWNDVHRSHLVQPTSLIDKWRKIPRHDRKWSDWSSHRSIQAVSIELLLARTICCSDYSWDRHDGLDLSFSGKETFSLLGNIGFPRFSFESSKWKTCEVTSI